jgi:hypothetical protein
MPNGEDGCLFLIRLDVHLISDEIKLFDWMASLYQIKEENTQTMDGRLI